MSDQAPALKIVFRKIKKSFLKKILSVNGKPIDLDWSLTSPDLEDAVFAALTNLRETNESKFSEFCTVLYDINAICAEDKKARNIIAEIKNSGKLPEAMEEIGEVKPPIELWVSWVYLRMPDLWDHLKRETVVKQINSLGGQKKYIKKPTAEAPTALQISTFESEFLAFMDREKTLVTFIHTVVEDMGPFTRFIIHVNPFPKQTEKFDAHGTFVLGLNQNADCFTIIHDKRENDFLRIKSEFNPNQRARILEIFAKYMLATEIVPKPTEEYPIKEFNPNYDVHFKPVKNSSLIESLRVSAATIEIQDPSQTLPEMIKHSCKDGDIFPRLEKTLHSFPVEWRRPLTWEFEFLIHETVNRLYQTTFNGESEPVKNKKPRKYTVQVTAANLSISNNPSESHRKLILDTLAENGIRNVYKKEYLAREYRK